MKEAKYQRVMHGRSEKDCNDDAGRKELTPERLKWVETGADFGDGRVMEGRRKSDRRAGVPQPGCGRSAGALQPASRMLPCHRKGQRVSQRHKRREE